MREESLVGLSMSKMHIVLSAVETMRFLGMDRRQALVSAWRLQLFLEGKLLV